MLSPYMLLNGHHSIIRVAFDIIQSSYLIRVAKVLKKLSSQLKIHLPVPSLPDDTFLICQTICQNPRRLLHIYYLFLI